MGRMGPTSLGELWALIVGGFGRKIGASPASTTVDVQLKNDAGTVLQTATIAAATTSAAGVMTAADKGKLNGIESGANATTVDSTVTSSGTNPVSGAAVYSAITAAIAGVDQVNFVFVQTLPATGTALTFYFVPTADPETENEFDEYIWNASDGEWEKIGTPTIDLSDYALKSDIPAEMTAAEVDAICTF